MRGRFSNLLLALALLPLASCGQDEQPEARALDVESAALEGAGWSLADGEAVRLLSDLDDTLKISHSGSPAIAFNAVARLDAYAGMSALASELVHRRGSTFTVLSGSPRLVAGRVTAFLEKNAFPEPEAVILKDRLVGGDETLDYKVRSIEELGRGARFVMLGDDTAQDAQAYEAYRQAHADEVAAIYIHRVKGLDSMPQVGQRSYLTAFEVAAWEVVDGRIVAEQALAVGEAVLAARDAAIVPWFAVCPSTLAEVDGGELHRRLQDPEGREFARLLAMYEKVGTRIEAECASR